MRSALTADASVGTPSNGTTGGIEGGTKVEARASVVNSEEGAPSSWQGATSDVVPSIGGMAGAGALEVAELLLAPWAMPWAVLEAETGEEELEREGESVEEAAPL